MVTQTQSPCFTSLTDASPAKANVALTYDASTIDTIGQVSDFVVNSDATNCPVTTCGLYAAGCTTPYATAYPSEHLVIESATPWTITARRNNYHGYTETVCVKCTNSPSYITFDTV